MALCMVFVGQRPLPPRPTCCVYQLRLHSIYEMQKASQRTMSATVSIRVRLAEGWHTSPVTLFGDCLYTFMFDSDVDGNVLYEVLHSSQSADANLYQFYMVSTSQRVYKDKVTMVAVKSANTMSASQNISYYNKHPASPFLARRLVPGDFGAWAVAPMDVGDALPHIDLQPGQSLARQKRPASPLPAAPLVPVPVSTPPPASSAPPAPVLVSTPPPGLPPAPVPVSAPPPVSTPAAKKSRQGSPAGPAATLGANNISLTLRGARDATPNALAVAFDIVPGDGSYGFDRLRDALRQCNDEKFLDDIARLYSGILAVKATDKKHEKTYHNMQAEFKDGTTETSIPFEKLISMKNTRPKTREARLRAAASMMTNFVNAVVLAKKPIVSVRVITKGPAVSAPAPPAPPVLPAAPAPPPAAAPVPPAPPASTLTTLNGAGLLSQIQAGTRLRKTDKATSGARKNAAVAAPYKPTKADLDARKERARTKTSEKLKKLFGQELKFDKIVNQMTDCGNVYLVEMVRKITDAISEGTYDEKPVSLVLRKGGRLLEQTDPFTLVLPRGYRTRGYRTGGEAFVNAIERILLPREGLDEIKPGDRDISIDIVSQEPGAAPVKTTLEPTDPTPKLPTDVTVALSAAIQHRRALLDGDGDGDGDWETQP